MKIGRSMTQQEKAELLDQIVNTTIRGYHVEINRNFGSRSGWVGYQIIQLLFKSGAVALGEDQEKFL